MIKMDEWDARVAIIGTLVLGAILIVAMICYTSIWTGKCFAFA